MTLTDSIYLQAEEELLEELGRNPSLYEINLRAKELLDYYCDCGVED